MLIEGERRWVSFEDLEGDDSDFVEIGVAFAASGGERSGRVGIGHGLLMDARVLVDFAVSWMNTNRAGST